MLWYYTDVGKFWFLIGGNGMGKTFDTNELLNKVEKRVVLKREFDRLKRELELMDSELKNFMTAQGVDEMIVGPYKMTYKDIKKNRFDSALFREENETAYQMYLKETFEKRFNVK